MKSLAGLQVTLVQSPNPECCAAHDECMLTGSSCMAGGTSQVDSEGLFPQQPAEVEQWEVTKDQLMPHLPPVEAAAP